MTKNITLKCYTPAMLSFMAVGIAFPLFSKFLVWNEHRNGSLIQSDFIINNFGPYDNNGLIFILTYGLVIFGLIQSYRNINSIIRVHLSIVAMLSMRVVSLYLFPLEAPKTIIPLQDVFLHHTFYCNQVLEKDLFFSGHTASVFLLFFLNDKKWVKMVLLVGGTLLGTLLILQHVHYTIDIIFAPFFSYLAHFIGKEGEKRLPLNSM